MANREIAVRGIGKATVAPDLIVLDMSVTSTETDYGKTMNRAAELFEALRSAIVAAGYDNKALKTTNLSINTKYKSIRNNNEYNQIFIGYSCFHSTRLEFDIDMQKLGALLGAIAECKANPQLTVRFAVKDPDAVSEQLLASAVEDARRKAEVLAKSAGVALGEVKRIDYNWSEHVYYSNTSLGLGENAAGFAELSSVDMDIAPEDIKASDTAAVIWAIEAINATNE